ncbi:MAG TPA: hypothetical protein VIG52_02880 [Methyloceanibacter sp.]|jgi:hypothetical protein
MKALDLPRGSQLQESIDVRILDVATLAAGPINEDRAGAAGDLAWVIDGATDVVDAPLTSYPTDASWIAETLDTQLRDLATVAATDLALLPATLAPRLETAFQRVAKRQPIGRQEHPSASGLIVRAKDTRLEYVVVGDCSLVLRTTNGAKRVGVDDSDAGDVWVAKAVRGIQGQYSDAMPDQVRERLWPQLRIARSAMNESDGYGVFSLTRPPAKFVKSGSEAVLAGTMVLLATDGLMRLVDVFRRYTVETLLEAASRRGLSSLLMEVRSLESADDYCREFPRAKCHDDATGLLVEMPQTAPRSGL